ncbi:hypothetical protein [Streptomyces brevispora]|uniref:Uncharacterized protein n=1 Tax=Streptomyces brevispora TaxID=887462 RepID=A0ABZ1G342_9ACTN|nr:hypothetical protein [Streptomyces brevispora]WSC14222.1 hypothetical protein OIE64_16130 [Streptomyces brevispora]
MTSRAVGGDPRAGGGGSRAACSLRGGVLEAGGQGERFAAHRVTGFGGRMRYLGLALAARARSG